MREIKTVYGNLSTPDWEQDLIVRSLRIYGEWAFAEQQLLAPMLRGEDRFWDVGAFLGTFGLGVSKLATVAPAQLVCVEPGLALLPHLAENLRRNAPCPAVVAPFGVALKNGHLRPRASNRAATDNSGAIAYEPSVGTTGSIRSRTLRDLRAEFGDYTVLKLDVEGMEVDAIKSDWEFIQKTKPVIWAECNESPLSFHLQETLIALGYHPVYVAFPFARKQNYNNSAEVIYPMAYEAALLAAPPERLRAFTGKVPGEEIIVSPADTVSGLREALWSTPRSIKAEWIGLSTPQLIGMLSHQIKFKDIRTFLKGNTSWPHRRLASSVSAAARRSAKAIHSRFF